MKRAEKIAAKLRDKGARENLITAGLLHDISLNGEIYLVSVDNIFGSANLPDNYIFQVSRNTEINFKKKNSSTKKIFKKSYSLKGFKLLIKINKVFIFRTNS